MRISRLFIDSPLKTGTEVQLDADQLNYVSRVLRLKAGYDLTVFNGEGGEFSATVAELHKKAGILEIGEYHDTDVESPLDITLVQGISRGERMDYTLQKAVELGVSRIVPVFADRTVVNLEGERLASRMHHWEGVIRSACEQCGRNKLPEISPAMKLNDWFAVDTADYRLMLQAGSNNTLSDFGYQCGNISLLIGPEGGLADNEQEKAVQSGFTGVSMGPRILRTETAGIAALASLQVLYGDAG